MALDKSKTKIGFAGLGLLGGAIAQRLKEQGWQVTTWNRTQGKAASLGLPESPSLVELAAESDVVMSCLANDEAAKAVYLGPQGLFSKPKSGLVVLEMSTLSPETSLELHAKAQSLGVSMLDLPVLGSTPAVKAGAITLVAGGEKVLFDTCLPIYESLAKQWFLMGPAGSGARMKLVVNLMLGVGMEALAEALALGKGLGLDFETLLSVLSKTAVIAPAFAGKFEKIQKGDYSPQFPLRLMDKDLGLVLKAAGAKGLSLPAAQAAYGVTQEVKREKGDSDLSVIAPFVAETKKEKQ
ncbi:MAG TPA: NAD(P)-dependent oxidoreductase [bacterium]|nr:NAD(P)-dependent oxidoreductase [bacterium]